MRHAVFLSTLSLRRATRGDLFQCLGTGISIHALLAESDCCQPSSLGLWIISIHALLAESDVSGYVDPVPVNYISIHALLAESDRGMQSAAF